MALFSEPWKMSNISSHGEKTWKSNLLTVQVKLEKLEYRAKVLLFQKINLKGETNISYSLITCKVRYFAVFILCYLL